MNSEYLQKQIKYIYFDVGDVLLYRQVEKESEIYAKTLGAEVHTVETILTAFYRASSSELNT